MPNAVTIRFESFYLPNVTPAKYSVCYRMTCANHCTDMATTVFPSNKKKVEFLQLVHT